MNFHLSFPIPPIRPGIHYSDKLLFMGSCFAENIGERMQNYKFSSIINPHGVLYNPSSIAVALKRYIKNTLLQENELFYANECWNSWEHHSRFSDTDKNVCLNTINSEITSAYTYIKEAEWLFITFGSAYTYKLNSTNEFVGNCHKIPQKEFTKILLSIDEIIADYSLLMKELKTVNSKLKIIFTVSPVRYIRDGITENTLSKARLIETVHQLVHQHDNVFYFPAYELMMDDLRDYRFYKTDLVHPNEQAIGYIFEKLMDSAFSKEAKQVFEKVQDIVTATQHRPFQPHTDTYKKFKNTYLLRCKQLKKEYSFLDLQKELNYFKQ